MSIAKIKFKYTWLTPALNKSFRSNLIVMVISPVWDFKKYNKKVGSQEKKQTILSLRLIRTNPRKSHGNIIMRKTINPFKPQFKNMKIVPRTYGSINKFHTTYTKNHNHTTYEIRT